MREQFRTLLAAMSAYMYTYMAHVYINIAYMYKHMAHVYINIAYMYTYMAHVYTNIAYMYTDRAVVRICIRIWRRTHENTFYTKRTHSILICIRIRRRTHAFMHT